MALLQTVTCACLIGVIAFFVLRELQITSVKLSEEIFIHAKRSDVYPVLMDLKFVISLNPLSTGLTDVVRGKTDDGLEEVHFVVPESVKFLGLYQIHFNISAVLQEVQPGVRVQLTGAVPGKLDFSVSWLLVDYKDGDKDGVLFIDRVEYIGMRFLVNFAIVEAVNCHRIILRKLKARIEKELPATQ